MKTSLMILLLSLFTTTLLAYQPGPHVYHHEVPETHLLDASLVAEVECVKAGVTIGEFEIKRSLLGPEEGTVVRIKFWATTFTTSSHPERSVCFVGERYVVIASSFKEMPKYFPVSHRRSYPEIEFRHIKMQYIASKEYGTFQFPSTEDESESAEDRRKDIKQVIARVEAYLKCAEDERPAQFIKAFAVDEIRWHVNCGGRFGGNDRNIWARDSHELKDQLSKIENARILSESIRIFKELSAFSEGTAKVVKYVIKCTYDTRDEKLLDYISSFDIKNDHLDSDELLKTFRAEREKYCKQNSDLPNDQDDLQNPDTSVLDKWQIVLKAGQVEDADYSYGVAWHGLLVHKPAAFIAIILNREGSDEVDNDWSNTDYNIGSYICKTIGKDRAKNLKKLLNAKSKGYRTAAAVYLYMEDKEAGVAELKKIAEDSDRAAYWAVLTLVRRGFSSYMPKLLEVFKRSPNENPYNAPVKRVFINRFLALLSNSAKLSGVEQPPIKYKYVHGRRVSFDAIKAWWDKHSKKITIKDVWLEELDKAKCD